MTSAPKAGFQPSSTGTAASAVIQVGHAIPLTYRNGDVHPDGSPEPRATTTLRRDRAGRHHRFWYAFVATYVRDDERQWRIVGGGVMAFRLRVDMTSLRYINRQTNVARERRMSVLEMERTWSAGGIGVACNALFRPTGA